MQLAAVGFTGALMTFAALIMACRTDSPRAEAASIVAEPTLHGMAEMAKLPHPIPRIYLRAIKSEDVLEVWGADKSGSFRLVKTFTVARQSGGPGPKRKEGDRQVPEGCYRIAVFNPESNFHLSLGLNYPNESDLVRSDKSAPGTDIYIHGRNVSIGCLAMTDPIIEQIYVMAENARKAGQEEIRVDIFPARPGPEWERLKAEHPEHASFWREIEPAYSIFETSREPAKFTVATDGAYRFSQ